MSQPSGSPGRSPRSDGPATPARASAGTPARSPPPQRSPAASAASQSPVFARTPGSGSPAASPAASPPPRTPAAHHPRASPAPSPLRLSASPVSVGSDRRAPSSRQAHRGFLGTTPRPSPFRASPPGGDDPMDEGNFLYGTDVSENRVVRDFHNFIHNYREEGMSVEERSLYLQELDKHWEAETDHKKGIKFPIKGSHIAEYSEGSGSALYNNLVSFPTEVIPIFDRELWNISMREQGDEPEDLGNCQVQIHDLLEKEHKIMRDMNPSDIEHLISLKGIVIRCSDLMPDMMKALFRCSSEDCKHEVEVHLNHWNIEEPKRCEGCGASHSYEIIHNDCTFADRQIIKLQESPESVPEGETPQNVVVYCFDNLVDQVRPGDRVEITGIYKAAPHRPIQRLQMCNSVYRTYLDAITIASESKGRVDSPLDDLAVGEDGEFPKLAAERDLDPEQNSDEDIKFNRQIRALAAERDAEGKPTVFDKLVKSFAPSIFEEDEVKKGLISQMFGGTPKPIASNSRGRCRPEINTLLCGDPSTAKSQLLQFSYKIAPRGVYTSGKGSSAVGLTATINKDPITKDLVLESGALVLSDRGLCCIDEFDKMDENARAILHEAMEQQTVSVAKAGIVCSLNARTAVLASANPRDSSYDPKKSVVDNINLPKNLMTRFDFIWLMIDKRNRDTDRRLAEHLVGLYSETGTKAAKAEAPIDADLFKRYVAFAKRHVFPVLTDEASEHLVKNYMDLRNQGGSREVITATPRILESLIRISESLAKMELREEVTSADVEEAVRLIKAATYAAAVDPETGVIDMEMFISGLGAGRRKRAKEMETLLQEIVAEKAASGTVLTVDLVKAAMNEKLAEKREQLLGEAEFNQALRVVEGDGYVVRRGRQLEVRG